MPPLVLWLLDGRAFLVLSGVCLCGFLWMVAGICAGGLRRVLWWTLLAGLVLPLTSTPLAPTLIFAPSALTAVGIVLLWRREIVGRYARWCGLAGICAVAVALFAELRWWPRPTVAGGEVGVVVIGDSLSAGISSGERTWPQQLAEQTGWDVKSAAFPGARIAEGARQLARVDATGKVVVILLGGNDMLGRGSASAFAAELEALVRSTRARGGVPLLIEFPVLPFRGGFGLAMRDAARRNEVPLLHRRHLAAVLQAPGATVDGLHLSESGHSAMALVVAACVER